MSSSYECQFEARILLYYGKKCWGLGMLIFSFAENSASAASQYEFLVFKLVAVTTIVHTINIT